LLRLWNILKEKRKMPKLAKGFVFREFNQSLLSPDLFSTAF
jgi:hypothetical protein